MASAAHWAAIPQARTTGADAAGSFSADDTDTPLAKNDTIPTIASAKLNALLAVPLRSPFSPF